MRRPASIFDGFFTDDVERVAAANRALRENDGADGDRSWGQVESFALENVAGPQTFALRGIFGEAIFGPLQVLRCHCGRLVGEMHRDTVCRTCFVVCGDPSLREWRWGHFEIRPIVHPLLIGKVAEALSMNFDEVAVAPDASALHHRLRGAGHALLAEAAHVERVPVPPPGDRPLVPDMDVLQTTPWMGPLNAAWDRLADLERRRVPGNEGQATRDAVRNVVEATQRPPTIHDWRPWRSLAADETFVRLTLGDVPPLWRGERRFEAKSERLHYDSAAALWIDEESFLIQLRFSVFQFDARGRLRATFPSPARRMRSVHGRFVVFEGWHLPERMRSPSEYSREEIGPPREVAIYDLQAAAFLSRWPDEVPAVGVIDDRAIVDRRAHLISKDPPPRESAALAWTRDARFLWFGTVFGGSRVMEMTKLIPYIVPSYAPLHADDVAGAALGVSDRMEWRFVHNNGVLTDGEQRIADLGPARAYAFSPSCKQIVRVNTSDMTGEILDGGGGRIRGFEVPDE